MEFGAGDIARSVAGLRGGASRGFGRVDPRQNGSVQIEKVLVLGALAGWTRKLGISAYSDRGGFGHGSPSSNAM